MYHIRLSNLMYWKWVSFRFEIEYPHWCILEIVAFLSHINSFKSSQTRSAWNVWALVQNAEDPAPLLEQMPLGLQYRAVKGEENEVTC